MAQTLNTSENTTGADSKGLDANDPRRQANNKLKIEDKHKTMEELRIALVQSDLEACQLIVGVDFTQSNLVTGARTFDGVLSQKDNHSFDLPASLCDLGKSLHSISDGVLNPYQHVLSIITRALNVFDDDQLIPCYGFGDSEAKGTNVFSFQEDNQPIKGFENIERRYREIVGSVLLSSPTSFGPLIRQAMKDVFHTNMRYHILLIIADGQVTEECIEDTTNAILEACKFPLSIIMIGVGDGPWEYMKAFDDKLPERPWDNFQFVEYNQIVENKSLLTEEQKDTEFARLALMEIPTQYQKTKNFVGNRAKVLAIIAAQIQNTVLPPPNTN